MVRAASYGLPLVVAVIGGSPDRFVPLVDLYHRALEHYGHATRPVSMHSPGHVAATDDEAREQMYPHQAEAFTRIGRERGWGPYTREQFEDNAGPTGSLFVGSPETVAQKIAWAMRTLGLSPVPAQVRRRRPAARAADGVDPALRHPGGAAGARAARCGAGRLLGPGPGPTLARWFPTRTPIGDWLNEGTSDSQ